MQLDFLTLQVTPMARNRRGVLPLLCVRWTNLLVNRDVIEFHRREREIKRASNCKT